MIIQKYSHIFAASINVLIVITLVAGVAAHPSPARAASTITVTTDADNETADDNFCTLREAIKNANADSDTTTGDCAAGTDNDTIVFNNGITLITLGSTLPTIDDADGLTINGGGDVTISGDDLYRVMIASNVPLTIDSLMITKGYCPSCLGAAIYSGGTQLTISNSSFTDNIADSSLGGAIYDNDGSVDISNSTFTGNDALYGGAVSKSGSGSLNVADSGFYGNTSTGFAGGAAIYIQESPMTISNSLFTDNHAPSGLGGAVYNGYAPTLTITNSVFTNNSASRGGAIYNGVNDSTTATITGSTFSGNFATTENAGGDGGAIYISGWVADSLGTVAIANSTFSGNTAPLDGGGIYNYQSKTTIINSTFSGNSADFGSDLTHWSEGNILNLYNSILANAISGEDCYNYSGIPGTYTITGNNNLIEAPGNYCGFTDGVNGNIVSLDPNLGPLTGSPAYFPLNPGSPALDAGDNSLCAAAPVNNTSQNGASRPQGSQCDTGSFEKIVFLTSVFKSQGANDGWVLESTETSNTGRTINATASTLNLGDDSAKKQYRSILSFDTSSLPDNAVITKVTLKLKRQGIVGGGNPVTAFQGFMVDIKKGSFGTAALALGDFKATANKTVGPQSPALTAGWYNLNLTPAKAYINKLATNGGLTQMRLRFKLDDNNNNIANILKFYSGNAGAANRPQLIVEYYVP